MEFYDALIVGMGPAGTSAAHYVAAGGYKVLIIGKRNGALYRADRITNFYGQGEIHGKELFERGLAHAKELGAEIADGEVFDIIPSDGGFEVTSSAGKFFAKTILIATGAERNTPKIAGLEKYDGAGVSRCAVCDGFFYRKKPVGVLGSGAYALSEADYLSGLGCAVTLFTDGNEAPVSDYETITDRIDCLFGGEAFEGVRLVGGKEVNLAALFIALGTATSLDFARKIGLETAGNFIKTNAKGETNCKGIYAAGDCTGGLLQIAKAAGDGAVAGTEMCKYLRGLL